MLDIDIIQYCSLLAGGGGTSIAVFSPPPLVHSSDPGLTTRDPASSGQAREATQQA